MSMPTLLWACSIAGAIAAVIPAAMFLGNLPLFRWPQPAHGQDDAPLSDNPLPSVSVLIPARNEESGIGDAVAAALASERVTLEVVVLDDHSSDATAEIIESLAQQDNRVRLIRGAPLPAEWNGKQHACWQLAQAARFDELVFLDADVRLAKRGLHALLGRQRKTGVSLLSAFPQQRTGTLAEAAIIPMMHFILLGFLPIARMRQSTHPAYAAGCGQLFMTSRAAYERAGTHAAIRSSRHDGVKLPRAYRQAGLATDVVDGTEVAECRMYVGAGQVARGVLKNAVEGIANPRVIVPFSVLLIGSSMLPVVTMVVAVLTGEVAAAAISGFGVFVGHLPRALAAKHFRQPLSGVLLHSLATLGFVGLQWVALVNHLLGRQVAWRGRVQT